MNEHELNALYVAVGGFVVGGVLATGVTVLHYYMAPGRYLANLLTGRKQSPEEHKPDHNPNNPTGGLDGSLDDRI